MITRINDTDNNSVIRHMFYENESNVMQLGYDMHVVHKVKTKLGQEVVIFDSVAFGRTLSIDGMVQNSVNTEFIYNEMMVHMPLDCQHNPKSVLVIGGGSGLVVNQILKYDCVEQITLCEISDEIIKLCEKYFPDYYTYELLHNRKVEINISDGYEFIKMQRDKDAIIVDCCDPIGCATKLYSDVFYNNCIDALSEIGVLCVQVGSPLFGVGKKEYTKLHTFLDSRQDVKYMDLIFTCPMIVGGFYMFTLVTKNNCLLFTQSEHTDELLDCKYYNPTLRDKYFDIPNFIRDELLEEK